MLTGGLAVSTAVQATTPPTEAPAEVHPFVGVWIYTVDGFPEQFTDLLAIHADGTFDEASPDPASGIGSWEATGPNSFNLTFRLLFFTERRGSFPIQTIRAAGEVSEDGQSFTPEFTVEFTGEGVPADEYGPGPRPERVSTSSRWAPRSVPWKPSPHLFPRGRHRFAGHRTVGDHVGR